MHSFTPFPAIICIMVRPFYLQSGYPKAQNVTGNPELTHGIQSTMRAYLMEDVSQTAPLESALLVMRVEHRVNTALTL